MKYICVKWHHSFDSEPVLMYSELDEDGWEHRKVEVFADERRDYASRYEATGNCRLSEEALPPLDQIARDPQFEPREISEEEFERIWTHAHD